MTDRRLLKVSEKSASFSHLQGHRMLPFMVIRELASRFRAAHQEPPPRFFLPPTARWHFFIPKRTP